MLSTAGILLLTIAVLFLSGYAPALFLISRTSALPRLVAMPLVGTGASITLAFFLALFGLSGNAIAWTSLPLFALAAVTVPASRRLTRAECTQCAPPLLFCVAGCMLVCWPLLADGFDHYMAFGNPDAAFNVTVYDYLRTHALGMPTTDSFHPWPGYSRMVVFGIGYLSILIAQLTGVSVLQLHEVTDAALMFSVPAAMFLFARFVLRGSNTVALLVSAISACASIPAYNFYLQSQGAVTLLALLPAILASWRCACESGSRRLFVLTGILAAGLFYGYYASAPVIALLLVVDLLVHRERRAVPGLAIAAAVVILANPIQFWKLAQVVLFESTSQRLAATLSGSELTLSFGFSLTEDILPIAWGVHLPQLPSPLGVTPLLLGAVLTVLLLIVLVRASSIPAAARLQAGLLIALTSYFATRGNGYGVFKLVLWMSPILIAVLLCGLYGWSKPAGVSFTIIAALFNVSAAEQLGASSRAASTGPLKTMSGYDMHDFAELEHMGNYVKRGDVVLVALPDPVVQRWAFTYLRNYSISVLPWLELSPDSVNEEARVLYHGGSESYILTWSGTDKDLVTSNAQSVVWRNAKFQLMRTRDVRNLIVFGTGWYGLEQVVAPPYPWMRRFRWLRKSGEILLFNAEPDQRLKFTAVAGYGKDEGERNIEIRTGVAATDRISIQGYANVLTAPIQPEGFLTRISLNLPDDAQPIPRRRGLLNTRVPKDVRRLNLAVANIELTSGAIPMQPAPRELEFKPTSAAWFATGLDGVYPDGWIAKRAQLPLDLCGASSTIEIKGFSPGNLGLRFPLPVEVIAGGVKQSRSIPVAGDFELTVAASDTMPNCQHELVTLTPAQAISPARVSENPEKRPLSLQLKSVAVQAKK